ncbi:MAG: PA1571 family protein [Pseudomonadota bacterium]
MHAIETLTTAMLQSNPFQACALLDENGREIPITEEMIVQACDELSKLWHYPPQAA